MRAHQDSNEEGLNERMVEMTRETASVDNRHTQFGLGARLGLEITNQPLKNVHVTVHGNIHIVGVGGEVTL